jgi:hypothetical protein
MRYLLNAAVITLPGIYEYRIVDIPGALAWVARGKVTSCVGYAASAEFLESILGIRVKVNRVVSPFEVGDEALVCRLSSHAGRPPRAVNERGGRVVADRWIEEHGMELGILKRIK